MKTRLACLWVFVFDFSAAGGVATISANCNSPFSPSSPSSTPLEIGDTCDITNIYGSQSGAGASSSPYSVSAQAAAVVISMANPTANSVNANAAATYAATLTFTISGSIGAASVFMQFFQHDLFDEGGGSESRVSLGPNTSDLFSGNDAGSTTGFFVPFTFDVPFTLDLFIGASADAFAPPFAGCCGSGNASAIFNGPDGVFVGGESVPYTFTMAEVTPEPSSFSLLAVGAVLLAAYRKRISARPAIFEVE